jgi:hypothetical protein
MPCPSADHLTEILNGLYQDPERRKKVGDSCYQRVTDAQFAWDTVASQFGGIFEDVMKEVSHELPVKPPGPKKKKKSHRKEVLAVSV